MNFEGQFESLGDWLRSNRHATPSGGTTPRGATPVTTSVTGTSVTATSVTGKNRSREWMGHKSSRT
eukprot:7181664-Pyramimonas_sp.AAC.1